MLSWALWTQAEWVGTPEGSLGPAGEEKVPLSRQARVHLCGPMGT